MLLEQSGAEVFLAEYSVAPGENLINAIVNNIKNCDLFILLWSEHSRASEWVQREIGMARGADKAMLPILLQDGLSLPGFVSELKYLDFYKDPNGALLRLQSTVLQLSQKKDRDEILALLGVGVVVGLLIGSKK